MKTKKIVSKWEELVTAHEATRAGFITIALEKCNIASPFVEQAKSLRSVLRAETKKPDDLLTVTQLYPSLLTASGLSGKSLIHLEEKDKKEAIRNLIEKFLKPAGAYYIDEVVYRFLLTKGDTLGGMMRNIAGAVGQKKFIRAFISALSIKEYDFKYLSISSDQWVRGVAEDLTIEESAKGVFWNNRKGQRTLIFNISPPLVSKNVDIVLLDAEPKSVNSKNNDKYIALGELKGGLDPAGADEHWKTGNTALQRIRNAFKKKGIKPYTLFIGAAIENSMAKEIFKQTKKDTLFYAANLTVEKQLNDICHWLCEL